MFDLLYSVSRLRDKVLSHVFWRPDSYRNLTPGDFALFLLNIPEYAEELSTAVSSSTNNYFRIIRTLSMYIRMGAKIKHFIVVSED